MNLSELAFGISAPSADSVDVEQMCKDASGALYGKEVRGMLALCAMPADTIEHMQALWQKVSTVEGPWLTRKVRDRWHELSRAEVDAAADLSAIMAAQARLPADSNLREHAFEKRIALTPRTFPSLLGLWKAATDLPYRSSQKEKALDLLIAGAHTLEELSTIASGCPTHFRGEFSQYAERLNWRTLEILCAEFKAAKGKDELCKVLGNIPPAGSRFSELRRNVVGELIKLDHSPQFLAELRKRIPDEDHESTSLVALAEESPKRKGREAVDAAKNCADLAELLWTQAKLLTPDAYHYGIERLERFCAEEIAAAREFSVALPLVGYTSCETWRDFFFHHQPQRGAELQRTAFEKAMQLATDFKQAGALCSCVSAYYGRAQGNEWVKRAIGHWIAKAEGRPEQLEEVFSYLASRDYQADAREVYVNHILPTVQTFSAAVHEFRRRPEFVQEAAFMRACELVEHVLDGLELYHYVEHARHRRMIALQRCLEKAQGLADVLRIERHVSGCSEEEKALIVLKLSEYYRKEPAQQKLI